MSASEARLNELLRAVDWRFLLRQSGIPRSLDLRPGSTPEGLRIVTDSNGGAPETSLAVTGFPTVRRLREARATLRPEGELVSIWGTPRPGGMQLARRRLRRAGFADISFYWPGPHPGHQPEFWLPLGETAVLRHVLDGRPAQSRIQAALRLLWKAVERCGALAPVYGIARLPFEGRAAESRLRAPTPTRDPLLLLTGGRKSDNKVVGFSFPAEESEPDVVVKFARTPASDASLAREAGNLRRLESERPGLSGVPRILARGRRAGRVAIWQNAVRGDALSAALRHSTFPELTLEVTRWLSSLAGDALPRPRRDWARRLVAGPIERLERRFGAYLSPGSIERARELLAELGDLPLVWEHRDLDPWNIVLDERGQPFVVDWERAEPRGLPGLDLAQFLLTAAFAVEGILSDPNAGPSHAVACRRRLLDPDSPLGGAAHDCIVEYCRRLGLDPAVFPRLRLLCWVVQAGARRVPPPGEAAWPADAGPFHARAFVSLMEDEIQLIEGSG